MRKSWAALAAVVLASGCCRSMSRLVDKRLLVAPAAQARPYERPANGDFRVERESWHDAARNRDVPVTLYVPAGGKRAPVVVFSHGIGEDRDSYEYLGRALAGSGYLAVHVTHAGMDKAVLRRGYRYLYRATKQKENWVNRPLDVRFVLDQLRSRPEADLDRVAVAGHSAGAFTALALAGMQTAGGESLADPRVKVAVAISMPKMEGVIPPGGYDAIRIPVLHMTGTCDASVIYRTFPRDRRIPFESTHAAQQYLVTLEGVNHDTFSNRDDPRHARIAGIITAFLDAFLLGVPEARAWFDRGGLAAQGGVAVERK